MIQYASSSYPTARDFQSTIGIGFPIGTTNFVTIGVFAKFSEIPISENLFLYLQNHFANTEALFRKSISEF